MAKSTLTSTRKPQLTANPAPTIQDMGPVLNTKASLQKCRRTSRIFIRGNNFDSGASVTINDPTYTWDTDAPPTFHSSQLLTQAITFVAKKSGIQRFQTGDITVTVTNSDNQSATAPLTVAYVDEADQP